jgi:hypothetical protein
MKRYGGVVGLLPREAICSVESVKGSGERSSFVFARSGTVTEGCTGKGGLTEMELIESMCDETINSKVDDADMVEGGSTQSSEDSSDADVM